MLRNKHTYIMINAPNIGICVEFWRRKNTTLVYLVSNCQQSVKTNPLNIIFDDFSIWLLGYRTEFSCQYLPQGHTFISTVWLWHIDECVNFLFGAKHHSKCRHLKLVCDKEYNIEKKKIQFHHLALVSVRLFLR